MPGDGELGGLDGQGTTSHNKCMTTQTRAQQAIAEICHQFGLAVLYVFGSQSRAVWEWLANDRPLSLAAGHDVDIGVKSLPAQSLTVRQKVELALALEALLGAARVDLVCLEDADPFLAVNIMRGERLYTADSYASDEYELYLLRRAGDLAPFERARMNAILEGRSA